MTDIVYSFAAGISTDWIAQDPILGVGQPAWEVDTQKGKVGDGSTPYTNLDYTIGLVSPVVVIDDQAVASDKTWSSLQIQQYGLQLLQQANGYTDQAVNGSTRPINMVAIYQNSDGTWPNRPNADTVVAYGYPGRTDSPTWLTVLVDDYKMR